MAPSCFVLHIIISLDWSCWVQLCGGWLADTGRAKALMVLFYFARCVVEDKNSKVAWLNRSGIIFAGHDKWSLDPRVELEKRHSLEYSLRIQKVDVYDEGSYTCSVQTQHEPKTSQVYLIVQGKKKVRMETWGWGDRK